jgi:hypothetical protein
MVLLPDVHHGFSCPFEPFDDEYLLAIARRQSARNVEVFLERSRGHLLARATGLEGVLEDFHDDAGDFDAVWHTSIGQLGVAHGPGWSLSAAVNLGLHVGARRSCSWTANLPVSQIFRFSQFELPSASRVTFDRDGNEATIALEHERANTLLNFYLEADDWRSDVVPPLLRVSSGTNPVSIVPRLPPPVSLPEGLRASGPPDEATRSGYAGAYALITDFAQIYAPWVRRTIRELLPLESPSNATCSNSFEFLPGLVALSRHAPQIGLSELLVHEASHQYFHLLARVGPVHDGSDTELYYSPAVRVRRPIDKILLAYHAFANIFLFYQTCRANGFEEAAGAPRVCADQEHFLKAWLDELSEPLRATRALTPIGRALFEPLAARVGSGARVS